MAWFTAMNKIWSPTEWARTTGKKYVNTSKIWYPEWYFKDKKRAQSLQQQKFLKFKGEGIQWI
jgi:hypothetical protein